MNCRSIHNCIKKPGITRGVSLLLSAALMLSFTACGNNEEAAAPELLQPVALTEACRPVERRDVGEVQFLKGIVTPESYPVYTGKGIMLYELKVIPVMK